MNHPAKPSRHSKLFGFAIALCATSLALAGCSEPAPPGPSPDGVDLRGSPYGGEFTLTSNKGKPVSWSDFDGKYRMVYLGFAYCPDICPTDVQRFSQGLKEFEKANPEHAGKVQPIFITVDPERDDVDVVDQFVSAFHPRLIGMTGTPEEIVEVQKLFGSVATKSEPDEKGNYDISHTNFTYLFSPKGEPLGIIPTDKGAEGVTRELEQWVR